MTKPEPHRSLRMLQQVGRLYPDTWSVHNTFRSERSSEWPDYVFGPRQAARLIVTRGAEVAQEHALAIAAVGTMAAWRPSQGIYRLADALLDALWATPVTGDLPGELLRRLPEWCVYIEIGKPSAGSFIHGAWARVGFDTDTCEEELDVLLDSDTGYVPMRLPLVGSIEESLRVSLHDSRRIAGGDLFKVALQQRAHGMAMAWAEPIVSVILYLCSVNADMRSSDGRERPARPQPRQRRRGGRVWPAAPEPMIWETGTRLGAALRRAERDDHDRESAAGMPSPSVRPHIRRAHWHTFWVGAHDSPDRHREVRWLPPIPVNLDENEGPGVATIRPVPKSV